MPRIDIARLRKDRSMSQSELARLLQVTQSFLSAIENGKSPLPPEKEGKLLEIFGLNDLSEYTVDVAANPDNSVKKLDDLTDSDLFNQLMSRFHQQAHSREDSHNHRGHHRRIEQLEETLASMMIRNDNLMERNDKLSADNDALRQEVDNLRQELFRLKSILVSHNISH